MSVKYHRIMSAGLLAALFLGSLFLVPALWAQSVALTPVDRKDEWWSKRHDANVAQMEKGDIDLLMIGDSITHGWDNADPSKNYKKVWDSYYSHRKPINLGFSGDRTEHVLWRLDRLPLDKISPKAAVLMIGTNNVGHGSSSPKETADGIKAIVEKLEKQYPEMKIIVLNVFPRSEKPDDPLRKAVNEINSYLPELLKGKENVTLLDINHVFLDADGILPKSIMDDRLHPGALGYELWAEALEPDLMKALGEENPATKPADKMHEEGWKQRFGEQVTQMKRGNIDFLMIGDSITNRWHDKMDILRKYLGPCKPINLGVEGDQTQHVLWRLDNLPLDKISPKVAMIMIGTNNMGDRANTPWMIADGVRAIVDKLQATYPEIKIVVLEVFPRGEKPDDWARHRVEQINIALRDILKDRKNVDLVDIGDSFKAADGTLPKDLMPDSLHLSNKGYEIWAKKLAPVLKKKFRR